MRRDYLHDDAITVGRQLWCGFLRSRGAIRTNADGSGEIDDAQVAKLAEDILNTDRDPPDISHRAPQYDLPAMVHHLLFFAYTYRDEWRELRDQIAKDREEADADFLLPQPPDLPSNDAEGEKEEVKVYPPRVQFHRFDTLLMLPGAGAEDLAVLEANDPIKPRPMSWLYQKWMFSGWMPVIVIDRECIANRHISLYNNGTYATKLVATKCMLHEIIHYVMHGDSLIPALPMNDFEAQAPEGLDGRRARAEWSTDDEEEQAWIGAMLIYGMMLGGISRHHRGNGQIDGELDYL